MPSVVRCLFPSFKQPAAPPDPRQPPPTPTETPVDSPSRSPPSMLAPRSHPHRRPLPVLPCPQLLPTHQPHLPFSAISVGRSSAQPSHLLTPPIGSRRHSSDPVVSSPIVSLLFTAIVPSFSFINRAVTADHRQICSSAITVVPTSSAVSSLSSTTDAASLPLRHTTAAELSPALLSLPRRR